MMERRERWPVRRLLVFALILAALWAPIILLGWVISR